MQLKVIGTGSKGNAYLLENEEEALLIECGVRFSKIKEGLNGNLSKVVGARQSHCHGDHSKGIKEALNAGIDVYMSDSDKQLLDISHHRAKTIEPFKSFKIGGFNIKPFDVLHDVPCFGFLINHSETGNVLFLTDLIFSAYTFKNLNNIIIEANYDEAIAKRNLNDMEFLRNRIIKSHMSLDTCVKTLKANDLSKVNNIVLIHLSDSNSNEILFRETVSKATGKNVTVADNGLVLELNKTPF